MITDVINENVLTRLGTKEQGGDAMGLVFDTEYYMNHMETNPSLFSSRLEFNDYNWGRSGREIPFFGEAFLMVERCESLPEGLLR